MGDTTGNERGEARRRALAIAFMMKPPTERYRIARALGITDVLPERSNDAAIFILNRVRMDGLVGALETELHRGSSGVGHG